MIVYAESSAVLRWLFREAGGTDIQRALAEATKVVTSRFTLLEVRRVVRRAVAVDALPETEGADLLAHLAKVAAHWAVLAMTDDVLARAEGRFPVEPIRTMDALHVASALVLRESVGALAVLSVDDRVRQNATALGFDVHPR